MEQESDHRVELSLESRPQRSTTCAPDEILAKDRSSSAWAKYADAFRRISFARRSSKFSRSRGELGGLFGCRARTVDVYACQYIRADTNRPSGVAAANVRDAGDRGAQERSEMTWPSA
jgi:hypothetical protein